ncbi:MAG: poly-beta-1,6-N-acetyl-D-glucosamine biosynthesis protein PgaD [Gammaproteobacteria bacterium]|nr:MAG: poly-beta-1,6-N-acetyl-D-glucosamine biosynthesis protein PgaD [Gammaproteobacteria bacterium]
MYLRKKGLRRSGLALIGVFVNNNLIIDSPKLQSLKLKYTSAFLTLVFWVLWFYLWIPLITLLGWWLQVDSFQHQMVTMAGYRAFLDVLPTFLLITAGLATTLSMWAFYNFVRFRGVDRRKPSPPVSQKALQKAFSISQDDLITAQTEKTLTIHFDQDGKITLSAKK